MAQRRPDERWSGPAGGVASYTNRHGVTYYLHEGTTKKGRPRYFARKTVGEGALGAMPEGFEFAESINGVVSVRRVVKGEGIPSTDLELVRAELGRHEHLRDHVAEAKGNTIVVHEPFAGSDAIAEIATAFGIPASRMPLQPKRYAPVMKFEREAGSGYLVYRMTYTGEGGWLLLDAGPLRKLATRLGKIGTDEFFELF